MIFRPEILYFIRELIYFDWTKNYLWPGYDKYEYLVYHESYENINDLYET